MNTNPTFQKFVDIAFQEIFDGLVTGGTREMKSRLQMQISWAANIMANGGFSKE